MIKVDGIQKTQALWEAVFLAASPLAISGSAAKTLFRAPTIPPATQANERSVSDGGNLCPLWLVILK